MVKCASQSQMFGFRKTRIQVDPYKMKSLFHWSCFLLFLCLQTQVLQADHSKQLLLNLWYIFCKSITISSTIEILKFIMNLLCGADSLNQTPSKHIVTPISRKIMQIVLKMVVRFIVLQLSHTVMLNVINSQFHKVAFNCLEKTIPYSLHWSIQTCS